MKELIKYISKLFLVALILVFLGNFALASLPSSTTPVVPGGTIKSSTINDILYAIGDTGTTTASSLIYLVTNTNSNNVTYSGRLTITNASTTNLTVSGASFFASATSTSFGTTGGAAFASLNTTGSGAASTPAVSVGGGTAGIFQNGANILGLASGGNTLSWNGTSFTPGTTLARNLGTSGNTWQGIYGANSTSTQSLNIPTGTFTLTQSGQVAINTNLGGRFNFNSNGVTQVLSATSSFSFVVASTTSSENITLKRFDQAVTVQKVSCVNSGGASPSVTFNLPHNTSRASVTNLFSSDQAETNTTTGTQYYTFNDATLAANEVMYLTTSASSGAAGYFSCTVYVKVDP